MPRDSPSAQAVESAGHLRSTMSGLGYSDEAARLYVRLLVQGPRSPARLETETGLRGGDLRLPIGELIKDGLVFEDRDGHQTIWYCFDPALSWLSLAARGTWSVVSTLNPVLDLPVTGRPDVDERRRLRLEALEHSSQLWAVPAGVMKHRHTRASNSRILARLVLEAVNQAQTRVRAISVSPKISEASAFWPVLSRKLQAGVSYSRIADVREVYEHGLEIVRRDLGDGVNLRLERREELVGVRGYLADRRILVRYDTVPQGGHPVSGVMTTDKHAIARYVSGFNRLWSDAVPALTVLTHLQSMTPRLIDLAEAAGPDAVVWFREMLDMGRYAVHPKTAGWSEEFRQHQAQRLIASGAAQIKDGQFLPAWPDPEAVVAELRTRSDAAR